MKPVASVTLMTALAGAGGYFADDVMRGAAAAKTVITTRSSCDIKGNISINSGEKIYHVPGQEHYDETVISPQYGERWFCSEAEARAAGWRRAKR
jgi:hypothetical protein